LVGLDVDEPGRLWGMLESEGPNGREKSGSKSGTIGLGLGLAPGLDVVIGPSKMSTIVDVIKLLFVSSVTLKTNNSCPFY
jgi:hypothetical protein